jgi:hypothetical protein
MHCLVNVVLGFDTDGYSYTLSEEINDDKTATQILCKGFFDADEANLLEEEGRYPFSISSIIKCYSWSLLIIMYF